MPDDVSLSHSANISARHDRVLLMAFVNDANDESALRQGLADATPDGFEIKRGGIRAAIAAMERTATPRILIVDVAGEDQPLNALSALSEVVEPDVQVLVIGEVRDADFYREITRGMGAVEYIAKPLSRDKVARHFGPAVLGRSPVTESVQGGRIIAVTGARGGVGATTVAVNLAWHFGSVSRRHTLLLDADLHMGTAALLLNTASGPGLRAALEAPDRVDELFVERAAQPVGDRLHVLSSQENLLEQPVLAPDATRHLLDIVRRRYAFIIADAPFNPSPFCRDLLTQAHQRVVVLEPTLASVRDAARLLAMPSGEHASRPVIVLNRMGMRGGMNRRQVEDALGMKADVAFPDLPQQLQNAANMGEPAAAGRGFYKLRISDLARSVASNRLVDVDHGAAVTDRSPGKRRWTSFLGRRS